MFTFIFQVRIFDDTKLIQNGVRVSISLLLHYYILSTILFEKIPRWLTDDTANLTLGFLQF